MRNFRIANAVLFLIVFQFGLQQSECPSTAQEVPKPGKVVIRGYENKLNWLEERRFEATDNQGEPAVLTADRQPMGDIDLKIVWTFTSDFSWNYVLPEFPGGKDQFGSKYPSERNFFERTLKAKSILTVAVPDTPYWFYIIDGQFSPFFTDSQKSVIWQFSNAELEKKFRQMSMISTSSKKIRLVAPGGDMAIHLIVDFSDRQSSPKIVYYAEYHGF